MKFWSRVTGIRRLDCRRLKKIKIKVKKQTNKKAKEKGFKKSRPFFKNSRRAEFYCILKKL